LSTPPQAAPRDPATPLRSAGSGPVDPRAATALRPLPLDGVRITDGLLHRLQRDNGRVSIRHGQVHLDHEQAWQNFENAAARRVGEPYFGPVFEDGEAFKWLEAAAWEAARLPAADLADWLARYSALAARAQADDGYLATFNQASGKRGRYEFVSYDHEIFNMATMIQAAIAQYRGTGRTALLDVALRAADYLDATFGWGKRENVCGHPLIEMALVELYRVTSEPRYLALASYFVERRGHGTLVDSRWEGPGSSYFSDRVPVRETQYPEGHAVRAIYFAAGATDVAIETGDASLLAALRTQWDNMVEAKMYINGSLGARWEGESFGDPYELPTDRGYGETCAAIACMQWSWRLLLATGGAKYAELIERQLYNAVLSGVSLDGNKYFYVNALQVRADAVATDSKMPASGRHEWFGCSCCPTNLMRTVATVHQYVATGEGGNLQLHQFASADIRLGGTMVRMRTGYPWDGDVVVEIVDTSPEPWELALRIPAWAKGASLMLNGDAVATLPGQYARISRRWTAADVVRLRLPMQARQIRGHHRVDAIRGAVAIERGPLVYAIEQVDQQPGVTVDDVELSPHCTMTEQPHGAFEGVPGLLLEGRVAPHGASALLTAIPYFMWANREIGPMRVWLPLAATEEAG
jgi:DUF1680 family protein